MKAPKDLERYTAYYNAEKLWKKMRMRPLGMAMNVNSSFPKSFVSVCYLAAQRLFSFN